MSGSGWTLDRRIGRLSLYKLTFFSFENYSARILSQDTIISQRVLIAGSLYFTSEILDGHQVCFRVEEPFESSMKPFSSIFFFLLSLALTFFSRL